MVPEDTRIPVATLSNNAAQAPSAKRPRASTPSADDSPGALTATGTYA